MDYSIEISFDIRKHKNVTTMKNNMLDLAHEYGGGYIYIMHDIAGKGRHNIYRNHCIISVTFTEDNIENCVKFIKQIKKTRSYKIECIYKSSGNSRLLYASTVYLKTINKEQSETYTTQKSTNHYTYNEYLLISELFAKSLLKDILDVASKSWKLPYPIIYI
jgi:hypothetical protein